MGSLAVSEVRLDRVEVQSHQEVTDLAMEHIRFDEQRDIMSRSTRVSAILRAFGKTERIELSAPETWWQHLKHALRAKWPRLFRWLRIRMVKRSVDAGAIVAGLHAPLGARHAIVPYLLPSKLSQWIEPAADEVDE